MVKVSKCSFCGSDIAPGTGLMYVRTNGEIYHFCSKKCRRYKLVFGKNPRHVRWTQFYGKK
jgi:large subunit ribosomal protein L24e